MPTAELHIGTTFWFLFTWQQYCGIRQCSSDINISASYVLSEPACALSCARFCVCVYTVHTQAEWKRQQKLKLKWNDMVWKLYDFLLERNCDEKPSGVSAMKISNKWSVFHNRTFCFLRGFWSYYSLIAYYVLCTLKNVPFNEQTRERERDKDENYSHRNDDNSFLKWEYEQWAMSMTHWNKWCYLDVYSQWIHVLLN